MSLDMLFCKEAHSPDTTWNSKKMPECGENQLKINKQSELRNKWLQGADVGMVSNQ